MGNDINLNNSSMGSSALDKNFVGGNLKEKINNLLSDIKTRSAAI